MEGWISMRPYPFLPLAVSVGYLHQDICERSHATSPNSRISSSLSSSLLYLSHVKSKFREVMHPCLQWANDVGILCIF